MAYETNAKGAEREVGNMILDNLMNLLCYFKIFGHFNGFNGNEMNVSQEKRDVIARVNPLLTLY